LRAAGIGETSLSWRGALRGLHFSLVEIPFFAVRIFRKADPPFFLTRRCCFPTPPVFCRFQSRRFFFKPCISRVLWPSDRESRALWEASRVGFLYDSTILFPFWRELPMVFDFQTKVSKMISLFFLTICRVKVISTSLPPAIDGVDCGF